MPAEITEQTVLAALNGMGDNEQAVARYLLEHGCKGRQGNDRNCPVARRLGQLFMPEDGKFEVSHSFVIYKHCLVHAPRPVAYFIKQFDLGAHPELIEKEDPCSTTN
jgi:hypothetical protein